MTALGRQQTALAGNAFPSQIVEQVFLCQARGSPVQPVAKIFRVSEIHTLANLDETVLLAMGAHETKVLNRHYVSVARIVARKIFYRRGNPVRGVAKKQVHKVQRVAAVNQPKDFRSIRCAHMMLPFKGRDEVRLSAILPYYRLVGPPASIEPAPARSGNLSERGEWLLLAANRRMRPTVADPQRPISSPNSGHSDAPSRLTKWRCVSRPFQDVELVPEGCDQFLDIVFFIVMEDRAHAERSWCNQIPSIVVDEDTLVRPYSDTS